MSIRKNLIFLNLFGVASEESPFHWAIPTFMFITGQFDTALRLHNFVKALPCAFVIHIQLRVFNITCR